MDVTATMRLSRAVGQRMQAAGTGVILNMGWDQAETGMEGDSGELFAASKGAVMAFTRSLALSLAPQVPCQLPGARLDSHGLGRDGVGGLAGAGAARNAAAPLGPAARCGARPLAGSLASENSMTGQVVRVNGGAIR